MKPGDFVDYVPDESTTTINTKDSGYDYTQTYKTDKNLKWQVLGLNKDGNIMLISSSIVLKDDEKDKYLTLLGGEGYLFGNDILDQVCGIYKNQYAVEARSITREDIDYLLGVDVDYDNYTFKRKTNEKETTYVLEPQVYKFKEVDYAPENHVIEKHLFAYSNINGRYVGEELIVNGVVYYKMKDNSATSTANIYDYPEIYDESFGMSKVIYELLFDKTFSKDNFTNSYWLANSGINAHNNNYATFGMTAVTNGNSSPGNVPLFYTNGTWSSDCYGVRPVVVLDKEVTTKDMSYTKYENAEKTTTEIAPTKKTYYGGQSTIGIVKSKEDREIDEENANYTEMN